MGASIKVLPPQTGTITRSYANGKQYLGERGKSRTVDAEDLLDLLAQGWTLPPPDFTTEGAVSNSGDLLAELQELTNRLAIAVKG